MATKSETMFNRPTAMEKTADAAMEIHVLYYTVHVLYCVLFYWYYLCSRKANFYVNHRQ